MSLKHGTKSHGLAPVGVRFVPAFSVLPCSLTRCGELPNIVSTSGTCRLCRPRNVFSSAKSLGYIVTKVGAHL